VKIIGCESKECSYLDCW